MSTDRALRAALTRLVCGNATRTNGRLTVTNLAREANVSRATANRAPAIVAELRAILAETASPPLKQHQQIDATRDQRDAANVVAQHLQVRALLQRDSANRNGKLLSVVGKLDDG
ncbi:hypothetical protein [Ensifer sp. YR511]|uniref:hypothetical protein n=1 Tax=Ensifer sp. YR511 TaxID=1855294 RepID=UPI000882AB81|nr:hypothetical protein [Ensifer sp. YR511]SDN38069.1 hypothetical protein SAMN05216328_1254 [Ensifer sp. YR511]SDN48356.1 hypothetical protein SAMN05216328_12792 [Ensifer sp. YR511]SDN66369.1 hypothetical protein SAMN05216328_13257 [Ensifer sp. YR511]SDN94993.1 hypothetical protein SAMN05216328_1442 [Ensifer sp. YR511]